jgi:hypothetical protein
VVVVRLTNTRSPFGPGKGRLGLQGPRFAATCYGVTGQAASQLAGAVSGALHNIRSRSGSGGRTIHLVTDGGWGGQAQDPTTKWIQEVVLFDVVGAA